MKNLYHSASKPLLTLYILLTITFGYSQKNNTKGIRKLIQANGIQIETFVFGDGPAALIMAAGNGRPAIQLDELAQAIASKGIKVVTYNYRTLGASTGKIEELTLHDYADDLWKVADGLGLKEVYLAGKTYGNRVVRTASQDHPERVLGIVLIGAGGEAQPSAETMALYQRYMDPSISKEEWLKLQGQLMYAPGNEHLALLDQAQGEFPTLAGQQAKSSDATPKEQWSTGGTAPMLVITCLLDRVAVPESALNIAKERPKTWLVGLPLCGHNMLNEKGNDIKRLIVEFILNTPSDEVKSPKQD
ncbi:alpha/beta fold hydrolase [Flavobacterium hungaricum]|uniref:Alpha/beta hydrolase n=1 Tax=Flavobacterium hungaricum TaxID=2082725 RepID=A0ABR9TMJ9_9FLAO|nr:alpha/beta hydrolase [Flavobacterium hungaricum]MBE8726054.1 alpha/beta hydrolase [Flavobacterium hungaricum]